MKNLNVTKVANILTLVMMVVMVLAPLASLAQTGDFVIPEGGPVSDDENVTDLLTRVINILLALAGLVAVIFLIVGGFRYITAGGNEEAAESGKKTITNAIIGIVVIILAFVIVRVVSNAVIGGGEGV